MSYPEVRFVTEMMAGTESFTFCVPKEIAAPTGTGSEYNQNITHRSEEAVHWKMSTNGFQVR
jgi:hypothetical protein